MMRTEDFLAGIQSDQGQPCLVRMGSDDAPEPARLYARTDGVLVDFEAGARGRIKGTQIAAGVASGRIRPLYEMDYGVLLTELAEEKGVQV